MVHFDVFRKAFVADEYPVAEAKPADKPKSPWYCDLCRTYIWGERADHDQTVHGWDEGEEEETVC